MFRLSGDFCCHFPPVSQVRKLAVNTFQRAGTYMELGTQLRQLQINYI